MSVLHMNVASTESLLTNLRAACEDINVKMQDCNAKCSSHVGAEWIAPAANQFQTEFSQLANQLKQLCSSWEALNSRLGVEITQWQETAASV